MEMNRLFSADYNQARTKFLELAATRSTASACAQISHESGLLWTDAAWFGADNAPNVLIVVSGTHGQEAFAGAAVQLAGMLRDRTLPRDVGVLLVHAINPYGFAFLTRTTESNVDLNRNFVDFRGIETDCHPALTAVQDAIRLEEPSARALQRMHAQLKQLDDLYGEVVIGNLLAAGQYSSPDGLYYGGTQPEPSRLALETFSERFLRNARRAAVVDLHVGLGAYGEPFFLCFEPPGTSLRELADSWWGRERLGAAEQGFDSGAVPEYRGLLVSGLRATLPHADCVRLVVEFGTYPNKEMVEALAIDRWLRFRAATEDSGTDAARKLMMDRFCPDDIPWRQAVCSKGRALIDQAVEGLVAWR